MRYLYQLPQNILGLIVKLICRGRFIQYYNDKRVYLVRGNFAVSLGSYILISKDWWHLYTKNSRERVLSHEYGHCRQSEFLGPLYLIVVGIPSLTMNLISRNSVKFAKTYYDRFPENWADSLGNVQR